MSADVSLVDDLLLTKKDDEVASGAGAVGNGFCIRSRRRRLSRILSNVYSQLSNVTPCHEGEANEDYLKHIFAIVDSEDRG